MQYRALLTAIEAAQFLGLSRATLYTPSWRRRYGVPAIKIGTALRFRESDLRRFLGRCREQPTVIPSKGDQ